MEWNEVRTPADNIAAPDVVPFRLEIVLKFDGDRGGGLTANADADVNSSGGNQLWQVKDSCIRRKVLRAILALSMALAKLTRYCTSAGTVGG